jgi:hypothetical protein
MKLTTLIKYSVTFFFGGIIGFVSVSWKYFDFDSKIGVVDIVNLAVTASLGYYIASSLQKKLGSNRVEKDLLIDEIKKIKIDIDRINAFVENKQVPFDETVNIFKNISGNISSVIELSKTCKIKVDCGLPSLQSKTKEIKKLVTGSNSQNGQFIITNGHRGHILRLHRLVKSQIFESIIAINRHDHE